MAYFEQCRMPYIHIFGYHDKTQQGMIEFRNIGRSNNLWAKILHKNGKKREFWRKIGRFAQFEALVLVGKNFLSLDADWDLLGICSGRKYVRAKEIVRGTQTTPKKIQISSILALSS